MPAKVLRDEVMQLCGKLHPGRAATDDHEMKDPLPVSLRLQGVGSALEGLENMLSDGARVRQFFQKVRVLSNAGSSTCWLSPRHR